MNNGKSKGYKKLTFKKSQIKHQENPNIAMKMKSQIRVRRSGR